MCDIEEKQEDEKNDDDEEEKEEEDIDREMGDQDEEMDNVVDEKQWDENEDEEEKENKPDEKFEKDAPINGGKDEEEMRAADEEDEAQENEEEKLNDENKSKEPEEKEPEVEDNMQLDEDEGPINEDGEDQYEDRHEDVPLPEEDEKDNFELPDEMDIGDDDNDDGKEDDEEEENAEEDVNADETLSPEEEAKLEEEKQEEEKDGDVIEAEILEEEEPAEKEEDAVSAPVDDQEKAPEEENDDKKDDENNDHERKEQGGIEASEDGDGGKNQNEAEPEPVPKPNEQQDTEDQPEDENDTEKEISDNSKKEKDKDGDWCEDDFQPETDEKDSQQQQSEQSQSQLDKDDEGDDAKPQNNANPLSNPNAALEHWRRQLQRLEKDENNVENKDDPVENPPEDSQKDIKGADDLMEIDEDVKDDRATQVLAADNQHDKNETERDETSDDKNKEQIPEDIDTEENEETIDETHSDDLEVEEDKNQLNDKSENDSNKVKKQDQKMKQNSMILPEDEIKDMMEDDELNGKDEYSGENNVDEVERDTKAFTREDDTEFVDDDDIIARIKSGELGQIELQRLRDEVNNQRTQSVSEDDVDGHALWHRYEALTAESAQRLTEQLRLVLAPMLATRLKGDYRSGKRINMRKVIPFIASQFRKDKIWLRRTMPSKRCYQVVVAIDDSKSMGPAGHMACEALATLCQAMSRLEVGELSVLSFGENVRMLHPFNEPFTDDSAGRMLSQFRFNQENTKFAKTIESITSILASMRHSQQMSAGIKVEFTQLVFMISDGIMSENREKVKQMARTAIEMRQMLVMIIVDDPSNENTSIYDLKTVNLANGKVQMSAYFDDYPISYYVVVQDPKALPEVMADALRQWFQMLSQD